MMEWNPDYKYKLLGTVIQAKGEYLLAFDLSSTEVYQRTYDENEKPKISRTPSFPSSWQNQFGLPYYEHRQSMQINIFDGYAIYAIKDHSKQKSSPPEPEQAEMEQLVLPLTVPSGGIKNGWR